MTQIQKDNLVNISEDQWSRDQYVFKSRLLIKLNNGETVYDDDGRPEREEPVFWKRFQQYMAKYKNLKIVEIQVQFRSNIISPLPQKADAYYFAKFTGADLSSPDYRDNGFVLGYVKDGVLHTKTILTPFLTIFKEDTRDIEANQERLIWNKV